MPAPETSLSALFAANLRFLAGLDPALATRLEAPTRTVTRPVIEDGAAVDIDIGDGRLYGANGNDFAAEQVASFMAQPTRLAVGRPDDGTLHNPCSADLVRRFDARLAERHMAMPALPTGGRSGILFVVGIGLGFHIGPLLDAVGPRHVVLIEPIQEFLHHAMSAVDWQALHARCMATGATFSIVAEADPATCFARIESAMSTMGETAVDGSAIYVHYVTPLNKAVAEHIHEFAGMRSILKGYFADERLMVENMTATVAQRDFRLLDGVIQPPLDAPVFVVGSGPSLDGAIDTIRRARDRAIIVSAGSALQPLLHHGIVPDYHVEKENADLSVERLSHIMARNRKRFPDGRFAGIRLIASSTVKPGVAALFEDVFLFLRSSLSSTEMFGAGHAALDGTSPFSANAALTVAAIMGFREVYLFGCDCGAREGSGHHSKETVYYTRKQSRATGRTEFPNRAPANFGGEVLTNSYFAWSRRAYEQVIETRGLTVCNCSDGAMISGAAALRPEDLNLANPPVDREKIVAGLLSRTTWYAAGAYLAGQDVAGAVRGWQDFVGGLRACLDTLDRDAADIHAYHSGVCAFLDAAMANCGGAVVLAGGTVRALPVLASYYLNRMPDAEAEMDAFAWFRQVCRDLIDGILAEGDTLMAAVAERGAAPLLQSA